MSAIDIQDMYYRLYGARTYEEFKIKCDLFGIKVPSFITKKWFNISVIDDYKWHVMLWAIVNPGPNQEYLMEYRKLFNLS